MPLINEPESYTPRGTRHRADCRKVLWWLFWSGVLAVLAAVSVLYDTEWAAWMAQRLGKVA